MPLDEVKLRALRDLGHYAERETQLDNLHELLLEINSLLDRVEKRLAELQGNEARFTN